MARKGFGVTVVASLGDGQFQVSGSVNEGSTSLDAAVAVLVADAASPTQAHVTTANAALTAFKVPHLAINYDDAQITSLNRLKRALDEVLRQAASSGMV